MALKALIARNPQGRALPAASPAAGRSGLYAAPAAFADMQRP